MDLLLGIVFLLFLGYFILLAKFLWDWSQLEETGARNKNKHANISVVIPVRNEADGIVKCVDSILNQDYKGDFNIIIVDDHSTDGTPEIIRRDYESTPLVGLLLLSDLPKLKRGKKAALAQGIAEATGEIIVTTDGDCFYSTAWLTTLMSPFCEDVQIVTGPVLYHEASNMLGGFQVLDLLSLILTTAAGIQSRTFFLGNGANLAFRKEAYSAVKGYAGNEAFASGDDLFLIQKIVEHYGVDSIAYSKSLNAAVFTEPQKTWGGFLTQRVRWASKNSALKDRRVYFLWVFIWSVHAAVIALLILGVFGKVSLLILGLLIYVKMLIEGIALHRISSYFNIKGAMRWFPWSFFLNILYVLVIGLLANTMKSFNWKDRKGQM